MNRSAGRGVPEARSIAAALQLLDRRSLVPQLPARQAWTDLELLILRRHLRPDTIEGLRVMCVACASIPTASRGSLTPSEEAAIADGAAALAAAAQRMSAALCDQIAGPALDGSALLLLSDWANDVERRLAPDRSTKGSGGRRRSLDLSLVLVKIVAYRVKDYRIRPAAGESRFMQVMRPAFALAGLRCSDRAVATYTRSMRDSPDRAAFAYWGRQNPPRKSTVLSLAETPGLSDYESREPLEQSMRTHGTLPGDSIADPTALCR